MRDRCHELCTKPTTGTCRLCDALDERDRFCRRAGVVILVGTIVVLGITRAWTLLAALGIFLLFWATVYLLRSSGFWQTVFAHFSPAQRNTKLGELLIRFFEGTDHDGIRGVSCLVLGSACSILAALHIVPSAIEWNWSLSVQIAEAVVLAITAVIVWRYTRETTLLRIEAQKQVEVAGSSPSLRPTLSLSTPGE